ncbi:MAG: hypothetical protein KGH76_06485 [Thaumarchaeota archaeon]|nr:hypothetical protein [Nitrososphaerota archaeon]
MQHKLIVVLLIVIFTISISQRESFAPIISSDNMSDSINNQTAQTSGITTSQNNLWYVVIIIGVIIGVILIYFTMMHNQKSS